MAIVPNMTQQYNVLMVCTGNICRSPTAHGFLEHAVEEAKLTPHVVVDSAGTYGGHQGEPPHHRSVFFAEQAGIDISHQTAQRIEKRHFYDFDLILAMTEQHKDYLTRLCPNGVPINNVQLYLDFSDGFKGEDMPDPYYYGDDMFLTVIELIKQTTPNLIQHIKVQLKTE